MFEHPDPQLRFILWFIVFSIQLLLSYLVTRVWKFYTGDEGSFAKCYTNMLNCALGKIYNLITTVINTIASLFMGRFWNHLLIALGVTFQFLASYLRELLGIP